VRWQLGQRAPVASAASGAWHCAHNRVVSIVITSTVQSRARPKGYDNRASRFPAGGPGPRSQAGQI